MSRGDPPYGVIATSHCDPPPRPLLTPDKSARVLELSSPSPPARPRRALAPVASGSREIASRLMTAALLHGLPEDPGLQWQFNESVRLPSHVLPVETLIRPLSSRKLFFISAVGRRCHIEYK